MRYNRELLSEVMKYSDDREAVIILGSRQAGKTTFLQMIMERIARPLHTFYIDLEDPRKLEIVEKGPDNALDYLLSQGAAKDTKNYLFIDEIHYMQNPSRFIKLAVDHYSDKLKLFCTGSSTLDIKLKFQDSLAGRKLVFNLYPLNFREFLVFKNMDALAKALPVNPFSQDNDPSRFFKDEYLRAFSEFLIFGGYPRVVIEDSHEKKEKLLEEIVSAYIYKDIRSLFSISDISKFNSMIKLLASQIGSLFNVSEISQTVGMSRQTVNNYLSILESSFIISQLPPYSHSSRVEIRKANKVYFQDNGIRNFVIGDLSPSSARPDAGALLENAVFAGLLKTRRGMLELNYWRTKDKTEVDFVCSVGKSVIPVEVKMNARPHRGLVSFMKKYEVEKGYIAHRGDFVFNTVTMLPAYWLA